MQASSAASEHCKQSGSIREQTDIIKYPVPLQGTSANLCYMHSWLLVGDICTSNDRVCKVPLQTNLKPTHHLLARWQGQVRTCLKTIRAINLFPPKWLPINCFTLTKDGLQTLNITAGHTLPDLQSKLIDIIKYSVPLQGTSANLCYIHSFMASCRRHLNIEWPGLQGTSANKLETYTPSLGTLAGSSQKVPQSNSCHQFVPSEMASHRLLYPN